MLGNLTRDIIHRISLFDNYEGAIAVVRNFTSRNIPMIVSFVNAHAFNLCFKHSEFCSALADSDILFRDGVGMEILFRSIAVNPGLNLNGTDLIPKILDNVKGKRIALFGTTDAYLEAAVASLILEGHDVVSFCNGFCTDDEYLRAVNQSRPDVIILGMGMPKQELLARVLKQQLGGTRLIINGGAIIDFLGKRFRRAPIWVRNLKIEWFYRFLLEPRRLFSRYMIGNVSFIVRTRSLKKANR